jgi:hypothetical protein
MCQEAYNVFIYLVVHSDTTTLAKHLGQYEKDYNQKPACITADAGYGSEENYQHLKEKNIEGFVKI